MTAPAETRVLRYEVPVDDEWHTITLRSTILCVASRDPRVVELWAVDSDGAEPERPYEYRVFGTGHLLPFRIGDPAEHVGTAITAGGSLVWHLFRRPA